MDKESAKRIVTETFKNQFDEQRFRHFVRNLFNEIDELAEPPISGSYIPDAFKDHVKQYKRIAKYTDPEGGKLDIVAVSLKKDHSLERARTMQRNFLADYLKRRGEKDAALVAYYTDGVEDWRFSYVRMDYRMEKADDGKVKVKTDLTPARRYSFLVGKNEPSHTAQQQLVPLLQDTENNPTLARIEQSFNIESVTKEFYQKYKELYLNLKDNCIEKELKRSKQFREELNSKGIDEVSFTKKLLGQIVFLYFIQKKGWLGVPKDKTWGNGDRRYLRTLLDKAIASKQNFYADYLECLFYDALATEHCDNNIPNYYKKLDCKIPFLNGGLFEADYDWEKTDITIPNNFFTNKNKTKEGDEGDGILDVFDRYNFTVKEDEPLEKEVAVDPEMLGKVFENLLEVKDRKSKGAYYTPREIVHYMCQESLINYLDVTLNSEPASYIKIGDEQTDAFGNITKKGQLDLEAKIGDVVKVPKSDIEEFIRHGIAALENDVRVESKGKETDRYFYQIPQSIRIHAQELDKALETIRICDPAIGSGAFPVGMMNEIIKARQVLDTYLKREHTVYDFKRHCIQECIYGVDIDHSAIDIAKLRLWLSLVVDEEDFYKIKPLPNLDYKIVCGNSLLGVEKNLFNDQLFSELEKLKPLHFNETNPTKKQQYKKKIDDLIIQITNGHKEFDFEVYFSEVFHRKGGFDVVIANPPYVSAVTMARNDSQKEYFKKIYPLAIGAYDIYILFLLKAMELLNKIGVYAWIIPNKFLIADYAKKCKELLIKKNGLINSIDVSSFKVFEETGVYPIIIVGRRGYNKEYKELSIDKYEDLGLRLFKQTKELRQHKTFKEFGIKLYSGTTGFQASQIIPFIKLQKTKNSIPFIVSGSVDRYYWSNKNVRYMGNFYNTAFIGENNFIADSKWKFWNNPKIIIAGMTKVIESVYSSEPVALGVGIYGIYDFAGLEPKCLNGLLNSKYMTFYFRQKFKDKHLAGGYLGINKSTIEELPLVDIDKTEQIKISGIVDKILAITKSSDYLGNPAKKEEVKEYEKQIDQMVYKLYNLTDEEIDIIEGNKK